MPTIYRARHRRSIVTDTRPHWAIVDDVTNEAKCTHPSAGFCLAPCPRHRPVDYAESMARHATDSIPHVWTAAERYHDSMAVGR